MIAAISYLCGDAMDLPFNKVECIEWDRYGQNCYENRTAPIRQFKDCLVGIDERLDLSVSSRIILKLMESFIHKFPCSFICRGA